MGLTDITDERTRLIMVGGKGGVGKTTCASAIALSRAAQGKRVLLLSSDPTPSLSDIFDLTIGDRETRITDDHQLFGLELSSEVVLARWKERFGPEIYEVLSSFARVDYDFVDYIGTAPGIEEEFMLHYILELVEGGQYDLVVWDTAPAGHTLRLLKLPQLFLSHMEAATKFYMSMYSYLEKLKEAVTLKASRRSLLEIINGWRELSQHIADFIRDGERTKYLIVTIPEALGLKLTERMVTELASDGMDVGNIVINYVIKDDDCVFHAQRRAMQQRYISIIRDTYPDTNLVTLYLEPQEVRGRQRIEEVAYALFDGV